MWPFALTVYLSVTLCLSCPSLYVAAMKHRSCQQPEQGEIQPQSAHGLLKACLYKKFQMLYYLGMPWPGQTLYIYILHLLVVAFALCLFLRLICQCFSHVMCFISRLHHMKVCHMAHTTGKDSTRKCLNYIFPVLCFQSLDIQKSALQKAGTLISLHTCTG